MLGIRKYSGTAIDLWQGDISGFVCDFVCDIVKSGSVIGSPTVFDRQQIASMIEEKLTAADRCNHRHVCISPAGFMAELVFSSIRNFLENRGPALGPLKRLTVVLNDSAQYELFQKALYREFPEKIENQ